MHELDLILTLTIGFVGALAFGYITHRLGWSPIVGYLLAGVLAGPHTPGFVADRHLADQFAEVGVILLMFGVGLHFHLKDLMAVRGIAIVGAVGQCLVATLLGAELAHLAGWGWSSGAVFGMALSVASTVVLIRVLSDSGELQSPTGRIAIGWLVMEDIITVFVLVILPVFFATAKPGEETSIWIAVPMATLKLGLFVVFTLVAGGKVIPWILNAIAKTHSRELFTLTVLAIAMGIAVGSAFVFGVSMALGAFLAGMVVGQSEFSARAGAEALPMRDAFAVMFFLSVGMQFNPANALESPMLMFGTLAVVMIGKPLAALVIIAVLGYSSRIGFGVAIALAQIGEFSFLLAALGRDLKVLPDASTNPLVGTAILSIMLNPMLYRLVNPMEAYLKTKPKLWRILNRSARRRQAEANANLPAPDSTAHHAVIVGYGPIGQTVARLLQERGIEPTIIEMNIQTIRRLHNESIRAVYGDANQREVLEQAGIAGAAAFILSSSGSAESTIAIRAARQINPKIHVITRADFLRQTTSLQKAGADEVFSGEGEVALAMTDSILRRLGTTPEHLDEERARIRMELFEEHP